MSKTDEEKRRDVKSVSNCVRLTIPPVSTALSDVDLITVYVTKNVKWNANDINTKKKSLRESKTDKSTLKYWTMNIFPNFLLRSKIITSLFSRNFRCSTSTKIDITDRPNNYPILHNNNYSFIWPIRTFYIRFILL